jgi:chromosome segregation ATPase
VSVESSLDGEILAIHTGDARVNFESEHLPAPVAGDYIYYQYQGKQYLIQDADTLAKARALLAPIGNLNRQQKELARQQAMLGKQQRALSMQEQLRIKVATPEFKRDMAELQKQIQQMNLGKLSEQIEQHALAEIQANLGELQGRIGQVQADLGAQQEKFGEQQGKLGEQEGKLGEEQGRLGEQERAIVEGARKSLLPILQQNIRDGKAKALN